MDPNESFERACAEIEMLIAAFEAEIRINESTDHRLQQQQEQQQLQQQFPLQVTFQLSPTVSFVIEWREGYPVVVPLEVISFRSSSSEEKIRLEAALLSFRQYALECHTQQIEAGLTCCSAALESWNAYKDTIPIMSSSKKSSFVLHDEPCDQGINYCDKTLFTTTTATPQTQPYYQWMTGEPLLDRKSIFQAHLCFIESDKDVQPALLQLLQSSTKIQRATHNMYAWRVYHDGVWKHDNDDDGEDAAGTRLAHLLSVRNENGVMIVVSRWFGGIHLGPKRFAHITNVARQVLDTHTKKPS